MSIDLRIPQVAAEAELNLPEIAVRRYQDQTLVFNITGTDDIESIDPMLAGTHVLFVFSDSAAGSGLVAGNNLLIPDDFAWVAGDTVMLWCDGTDWRLPSSADFAPPPVDIDYYQTVKDPAGAAVTQRAILKFTGSIVTVNDVGGETVVDITPAADVDFYQTVKDPAGSALTQRSVLKFVGTPVTVADTGGETVVTIAAATFTDPIIVDAAAADTLLDTSEQTIITTTTTPVAGNKVVKLTYVSPYFNSGTLTGVGRVKLYKNVNGGGDVLVGTFEIDRFPLYGHRTFVWFIPAMANQSTVFTVKETISASGGSLYNASSAGNTASPARLTIEQY